MVIIISSSFHFPSTRRSSIDNHGAITARDAYYQSSIVQTIRVNPVNRTYTHIYILINEKSVHEWL